MVTKREFGLTRKKFLLFFLLANLGTPHLHARQKEIELEQITVEQGLSQNFVEYIYQDSKGFMWFGPHDCLNLYHCYTFKVYSTSATDTTAISGNNNSVFMLARTTVFDKSTEFEIIPEGLANYSQTPFVAA